MTTAFTVSTDWLADHLDDDTLKIIDIRGHVLPASEPHPHYFHHRDDYLKSHIPGAVFVDWTSDITDPSSPNGTQIAPPEAYATLMSRLGISNDSFIVIYDDANGMFAARMWWSLRYYGHTDAAILSGGWKKWVAENRTVTDEVAPHEATHFDVQIVPKIRRTIDEVAGALGDENVMLVDVRSLAEFNGEASRVERAGHIPGAVNLPRKSLLDNDGQLPDMDTLKAKFASIGLHDPDQEVIVYCNGGVSASFGMVALNTAGFNNVAVYDGSWKEWGRDASRPIE